MCSHPRLLQHTSPQYLGLDAHLTYPHAPASDPLVHVDEEAAQRPLCFHAKLPGKLAFVPYPWASSCLS